MIRNHRLAQVVRDLRDAGATPEARHIEELIVRYGEDSTEVAEEVEVAEAALS
jgi:hypothetical protein